jgi:hypothetical protein
MVEQRRYVGTTKQPTYVHQVILSLVWTYMSSDENKIIVHNYEKQTTLVYVTDHILLHFFILGRNL